MMTLTLYTRRGEAFAAPLRVSPEPATLPACMCSLFALDRDIASIELVSDLGGVLRWTRPRPSALKMTA